MCCKVNGGQVPFGYIINFEQKLEPDKTAAPIVEEIFKMYADGKRIKEIVDYLNTKHIRTKFDRPMSINIVQYMFSNRKYIGEFRYRNITIPDVIPPFVDKTLFEVVQEHCKRTRKRRQDIRQRTTIY